MASAKFEDLYEVIGLRGGEEGLKSSAREIEQAYRRKARELHPDKNPGDLEATAKFQKLQAAFEVLKDDARRRAHDCGLRAELRKRNRSPEEEFETRKRTEELQRQAEEFIRACRAEHESRMKGEEEERRRKAEEEERKIREDAKQRSREFEERMKRQQEQDRMARMEFNRFASEFLARQKAEEEQRRQAQEEDLRAAEQRALHERLAQSRRLEEEPCGVTEAQRERQLEFERRVAWFRATFRPQCA